jgi:hypothetical protein
VQCSSVSERQIEQCGNSGQRFVKWTQSSVTISIRSINIRHPEPRHGVQSIGDSTKYWYDVHVAIGARPSWLLFSIYIRVERSNPKVKVESANGNGNASSTSKTAKVNPIIHGPSLPTPKTQVSSTASTKTDGNDTSPTPTTTGRTIKVSSNGNDRHDSNQISSASTIREILPPARKETSTSIDR